MKRRRQGRRPERWERRGERRVRPNNSWQNGKRTDGNRSRQFMQPLPQVNAASDTLRYADLKALLDSVCPPSFLDCKSGSLRLSASHPLFHRYVKRAFIFLSRREKYCSQFFFTHFQNISLFFLWNKKNKVLHTLPIIESNLEKWLNFKNMDKKKNFYISVLFRKTKKT